MKNEFNWYTELDKAILNEPELAGWNKLADMSKDWVTCACGQLCNKLPRTWDGAPADSEIYDLGNFFHSQVFERSWKSARATLDKIEARTTYLLSLPTPL